MSEGTRYQSTVAEWAKLINAPKEHDDDTDVYAKPRKGHNSMAHMYKEIPDTALEHHQFGSVYYLLSGLPTINTILRHTLLPKSGYQKMVRGHSINFLHMFDVINIQSDDTDCRDNQKDSCRPKEIMWVYMLHTSRCSSTPRWEHAHTCWTNITFP